jgi:hypothetical protein
MHVTDRRVIEQAGDLNKGMSRLFARANRMSRFGIAPLVCVDIEQPELNKLNKPNTG